MPYSTPGLIREALAPGNWLPGTQPDPLNPTNTAADLSDAQLTDAIAEADSFIDSYIGAQYLTPVAADTVTLLIPHPIDYWSRNIAAYNATLTQRGSLDFPDTDPVARRYLATVAALTAVRDGKATLPIPDNSGPSGAGAGDAINPYQGQMFVPGDFNLGYGYDRGFGWTNDGCW